MGYVLRQDTGEIHDTWTMRDVVLGTSKLVAAKVVEVEIADGTTIGGRRGGDDFVHPYFLQIWSFSNTQSNTGWYISASYRLIGP